MQINLNRSLSLSLVYSASVQLIIFSLAEAITTTHSLVLVLCCVDPVAVTRTVSRMTGRINGDALETEERRGEERMRRGERRKQAEQLGQWRGIKSDSST